MDGMVLIFLVVVLLIYFHIRAKSRKEKEEELRNFDLKTILESGSNELKPNTEANNPTPNKNLPISVEVSENNEFKANADYNVNIDTKLSIINEPYVLVFDVETSGLIPRGMNKKDIEYDINFLPNIVQIAWIVLDSHLQIIDRQSFYLKQDKPIPEETTLIHGITDEIVKREGVEPKLVLENFRNVMKSCKYLVAHNMEFDFKMIEIEFFRLGIRQTRIKKICTMLKGMKIANICFYDSSRLKFPKLNELFGRLVFDNTNINIVNSHNAYIDTLVTLYCFQELLKRGEFYLD